MRYHCATSALVNVSADLKDSSRFRPTPPHPPRRFIAARPRRARLHRDFRPVAGKEKTPELPGVYLSRTRTVGDTGIEPVTSSVSGKRATAAPIAHFLERLSRSGGGYGIRTRVDGFAGRCLASRPTHHLGFVPKRTGLTADPIRADDEIRTRDPHLGKVMRYHCATSATARISARLKTLADTPVHIQTEPPRRVAAPSMCAFRPVWASIGTRGCR